MKLGSLEECFRRSAFDVIYVDGCADGDEEGLNSTIGFRGSKVSQIILQNARRSFARFAGRSCGARRKGGMCNDEFTSWSSTGQLVSTN